MTRPLEQTPTCRRTDSNQTLNEITLTSLMVLQDLDTVDQEGRLVDHKLLILLLKGSKGKK